MNCKPRLTVSRVVASGTVALVLVAGPLLTGALDAQPPSSPPPPLPVREQNLDANGFIRVHEQGTTQVNGTVTVNGGTVTVSNLPSALNVHQSPVAGALAYYFQIAHGTSYDLAFPTINATAIQITSFDEVQVRFRSPLSSLTYNATPNMLLWFHGTDGEFKNFVKTFTQPIPLYGADIACLNESLPCSVVLSIIGSSQ